MDEWVSDLMAEAIIFHKNLGEYKAWLNWFDCFDIDQTSHQFKNKKAQIGLTEQKILVLKEKLSQIFNEDELNILLTECFQELESFQETTEQEIETKHRPPGVKFNENALVILTETVIPEDIRIALSFGYKFLFPYECNNKNMHEILAQLEMTMVEALPELKQIEAAIDIRRILNKRDKFQENETLKWLKFISNRTSRFFKDNAHLFATKSDKGGHTVVIEVASYEQKLASLLNDDNYVELDHDPLLDLIKEDKIIYDALHGNEVVEKLSRGLPLYEPDTFHLAKFYGLIKIHKEGIPLRPITSTIGSPGYLLAKIFTRCLERVFPRTEYHIRDSYEFVEYLDGVSIKEDDILVSFDVVSMYTSIPFNLVKEIIMSKADAFLEFFGIDAVLLLRLIKHLLIDCMIFTALEKTYKQVDGLPMGSCASPILARIVMDKVIENLLEQVPYFSFIQVFVDDTIAAVNKNFVDEALQVLNNFSPNQLKFTRELENEHAKINFLNTTLMRENDKVVYCWHRKGFYSGRLLNFLSSHKRTTAMGTAVHFIQTVLRLSDARFFQQNVQIVKRTLLDNNFPETTVISLMNNFYSLMRPTVKTDNDVFNFYEAIRPLPEIQGNTIAVPSQRTISKDEDQEDSYVIFPHSICKGREIKRVIHKLKSPGIILADSVRNTRVNSITSRKTIIPIEKRKNLILIARCVCKKRFKITKTGFNETGEMTLKKIVTRKNECDQHSHAYKKVQFHKGLFYDGQTSFLLKYIQWKYQKRIDVSQCRYEWPRFHRQFGKLFSSDKCH